MRSGALIALIIASTAASARGDTPPAVEDPPPLTPRYPTPTELEEDAARPVYARPVAPPEDAVATVAAEAAAAIARAPRYRTVYFPPALLAHGAGGRPSWAGEPLLARPRELARTGQTYAEARARTGRAVLYARGFAHYLSGGHAQASGTDLVAYADLAEGFAGSAQFHHEFREERGALGVASLAIRVAPEVHVTSTVAAGNGVDYLPITALTLGVSAPCPGTCKVRYTLAAGTSWWAHAQRELTGGAALRALLPRDLAGELRADATVTLAPDDDAHLGLRGTLTLARLRHGARGYQARLAVGDAPAYRPGALLAQRDDRVTIEGGVGVRGWLRRSYGYLVELEGGHELEGHTRVGAALTVFLEL